MQNIEHIFDNGSVKIQTSADNIVLNLISELQLKSMRKSYVRKKDDVLFAAVNRIVNEGWQWIIVTILYVSEDCYAEPATQPLA